MKKTRSQSGMTQYFDEDKKSGVFVGKNGSPRIWARGVIAPNLKELHQKLSKRY